jgi:hypothetical protein
LRERAHLVEEFVLEITERRTLLVFFLGRSSRLFFGSDDWSRFRSRNLV